MATKSLMVVVYSQQDRKNKQVARKTKEQHPNLGARASRESNKLGPPYFQRGSWSLPPTLSHNTKTNKEQRKELVLVGNSSEENFEQ